MCFSTHFAENCVHGDILEKFSAFEKPCAQTILETPSLCYKDPYNYKCCESCERAANKSNPGTLRTQCIRSVRSTQRSTRLYEHNDRVCFKIDKICIRFLYRRVTGLNCRKTYNTFLKGVIMQKRHNNANWKGIIMPFGYQKGIIAPFKKAK